MAANADLKSTDQEVVENDQLHTDSTLNAELERLRRENEAVKVSNYYKMKRSISNYN